MSQRLTSLEVCAGAGGQALGLEQAGFDPVLLVDNDSHACATLRVNRPDWRVLQTDLKDFVGTEHDGVSDVDLLSGGVPSAPFSIAGKQQGTADDRDLLRTAVFLAMDVRPRAILLETTPSLLTSPGFEEVRSFIKEELRHLGYELAWKVLDAQHFGVPQTRRSSIIIAMPPTDFARFEWPRPQDSAPTVGEVLRESMGRNGWTGAEAWAVSANRVAPTIVGGSKKHGGADLGPTRTKRSWLELGVDGSGLADEVPGPEFVLNADLGRHGLPRLTVEQVAILQGLPADWLVTGRKTARYRQVAQMFPPAIATAVGRQIWTALQE
ncbi:DNA cytosine methyltransferase [Streptosporangium pseudovulgare]|uniref:DNA (cytosine-5-)-methyltransferase n=1 Tax=Streptosporangium pseudovulgare TaxID=35765 RepID=A0ABQ2QPI8_9ACTN|nr:DNA (cytosine-5-)-methyltransferase [Streptosporangium pseudovulgare]GGP91092.1 cytosine-specific methyltransferase [Streptosporangium pseudovulgare]